MADYLQQVISTDQRLEQKQQLVPQQLQSLQILMATTTELEQRVDQEMRQNPTLERLDGGPEQLAGDPMESDTNADTAAGTESADPDEALSELMRWSAEWSDVSPPSYTGTSSPTPEDEERRRHFFDSLVAETTLQDVLLMQLRELENLNPDQFRVGQEIVGNIEESGYLRTPAEEIAAATNTSAKMVNEMISVVQRFDPPGVGARDLRECMLLQLERTEMKDSLLYHLVRDHLEDLGRNRIPSIASALGVNTQEVYQLAEQVRRLHPSPGSLVSAPTSWEHVVPEVFIQRDENGDFTVITNKDCVPRLRISRYYQNMLRSSDTPTETKQYIREKIAESKFLMRALTQRQSTIEQISWSLLKFQRDFFEYGMRYLKPLVLNQVAEEIGVHETTVSRAIAGKYLQTPFGLMPFKKFFTAGVEDSSGEKVSNVSVKERIRELIENENPRKPLSDSKLTKTLKDEGLNVARRTVAKYREELGILSSHLRKSY